MNTPDARESAWLPLESARVFCVGVPSAETVKTKDNTAARLSVDESRRDHKAGARPDACRNGKVEKSPGDNDDIFMINGGIELGTASCPGSPGSPQQPRSSVQPSQEDIKRNLPSEADFSSVTVSGRGSTDADWRAFSAQPDGPPCRTHGASPSPQALAPPSNGAAADEKPPVLLPDHLSDDGAAHSQPLDRAAGSAEASEAAAYQNNSSYSILVRSMVGHQPSSSHAAQPQGVSGAAAGLHLNAWAAPGGPPRATSAESLCNADPIVSKSDVKEHTQPPVQACSSVAAPEHAFQNVADAMLVQPTSDRLWLPTNQYQQFDGSMPDALNPSTSGLDVSQAYDMHNAVDAQQTASSLAPGLFSANAQLNHSSMSEPYAYTQPHQPQTFFPEYYSCEHVAPSPSTAQGAYPRAWYDTGNSAEADEARQAALPLYRPPLDSSQGHPLSKQQGSDYVGSPDGGFGRQQLSQRASQWLQGPNQHSASTGALGLREVDVLGASQYGGRPVSLTQPLGVGVDFSRAWPTSASALDVATPQNGIASFDSMQEALGAQPSFRPITEASSMPQLSEAYAAAQVSGGMGSHRMYFDHGPRALQTPPTYYADTNGNSAHVQTRPHIRSHGNLQRGFDSSNSLNTAQNSSTSTRVTGEHPLGEYPSRTLFVRNINSHTTDEELLSLFREYGEIRSLYTACKHRGFVMISYYDIRAAMQAKQYLQGHTLRQRDIDIHFSVPKENSPEPDLNQGTLVVFNVDQSVPKSLLKEVFLQYGEVKEVRSTPGKDGHKFVEFYDARHANAALHGLHRAMLNGRQLKIELSRPGGVRRARQYNSNSQNSSMDNLASAGGHHSAVVPPPTPPRMAARGAPASSYYGASTRDDALGIQALLHGSDRSDAAKSEMAEGFIAMMRTISANAINDFGGHQQHAKGPGVDPVLAYADQQKHNAARAAPIGPAGSSSGAAPRAPHASDPGQGRPVSRDGAQDAPAPFNRNPMGAQPQHNAQAGTQQSGGYAAKALPEAHAHHMAALQSNAASTLAAAAASVATALARDPSIPQEQQEQLLQKHLLQQLQQMQLHAVGQMVMDEIIANEAHANGGPPGLSPPVPHAPHSLAQPPPASAAMPMPQPPSSPAQGNDHSGSMPDSSWQSGHSDMEGAHAARRGDATFVLDPERVLRGEDRRTTLMIRNIPNKYSQKMLLQTIDEGNRGTYDFLYLPIDFKNRCNVGYAFINMASTQAVLALYNRFHNARWEKFNSEKQCCISYARIQGRKALIHHFQNSSLMNEDKRCRPVLLAIGGDASGAQEPFPAPKGRGVRPGKRGARAGRRSEDDQSSGYQGYRRSGNCAASLTSGASDEE